CKDAKECFVCGTGAIITSVSKIMWKGEEYDLSGNNYAMAHRMYDKLTGIQLEREEDPYGWIMEMD
ncbi:MAG: branched chain amino acid aminotransferase, partial [Calditrichota bacterium]